MYDFANAKHINRNNHLQKAWKKSSENSRPEEKQ